MAPAATCALALLTAACDTGEALKAYGQAANRVEATVASGAEALKTASVAVQNRLGLAPPVPDKKEIKPGGERRARRRTDRPSEAGITAESHTNTEPAPISPQEVTEPVPPVSSSSEHAPVPPPEDVVAPAPIEDVRIYSRTDLEVVPPRLVRSQVSTPIFFGVEPSLNVIELIVSTKGRVEEARLRSPLRRLTDVQIVSGAKAWEFEPARRAGVAVRYRLTVTWDATP